MLHVYRRKRPANRATSLENEARGFAAGAAWCRLDQGPRWGGMEFASGVTALDQEVVVALREWRWTRVALLCVIYWVTLGTALLASTMMSVWSDRNRLAQAQGNADFLVTYGVDVNVGPMLLLALVPPLVLTVVWWQLRRRG